MKKNVSIRIVIGTVMMCLLVSLTGCQKLMEQEKEQPGKTVDEELYTGFDDIPKGYTYDQAKKDGCIIFDKNVMVCGKDKWKEFVETTQAEEPVEYAKVRIRQVVNDSSVYYEDIIFKNGKYRMIISKNPEEYDFTYEYLMDIEGKASKKLKSSRYVFLTNDKDITFEDILADESVSQSQKKHDYQLIFHE